MPKKLITEEMVETWLGTSSPMSEAIEVITSIANGEYKPALLREEIRDCTEEEDNG
jgi:hypothetical protein